MTNTALIKDIISKSGLKLEFLAGKCGITRQALSNKIANRSEFTAREIGVLCQELKICDLEEKERIFYAQ